MKDYDNYECERCAANQECIHAHDIVHIYGCIGFIDKSATSKYNGENSDNR